MSKGSRRPPSDDFGEDEPTVVDGAQFVEALNETPSEFETPVETPRCVECGGIVFVDNAALVHFPDDHCLRSLDGHWHWCHQMRKAVTYVPR